MTNLRKNDRPRKWWCKIISLARKIAWSYIIISYTAILAEKVSVADPLSSVLDEVSRPFKVGMSSKKNDVQRRWQLKSFLFLELLYAMI